MLFLNGLDARRTVRRLDAEAPISLLKRRVWFVDPPPPAPDPDPASSGGADDEPDEVAKLPKWAQDLIKGLRDESAAKRTEAKRLEDEKAANEAAKLAEQGKFEDLYKQKQAELDALKPVQERAAALEEKISATNQKRINRIPEAMRAVIPTRYTPEELSEWLDANEQLLVAKPAPPPLDGGRQGDGGATPKPEATPVTKTLGDIANAIGYKVDPVALAERERQIKAQRQRNPKPEGE